MSTIDWSTACSYSGAVMNSLASILSSTRFRRRRALLRVAVGVEGAGPLNQPGQQGGLLQREFTHLQARTRAPLGRGHCQLAGRGAEVLPGGGLDPVGAVAEVHPVQVVQQDEVLGEVLLEAPGHEELLDLARRGLLGAVEEHVADVLLGDGGTALADPARGHVRAGRPQDGLEVHSVVLVETLVLDGHDRVADDLGDELQMGHVGAALLAAQLGDERSVAVINARRLRRGRRPYVKFEVGRLGRAGRGPATDTASTDTMAAVAPRRWPLAAVAARRRLVASRRWRGGGGPWPRWRRDVVLRRRWRWRGGGGPCRGGGAMPS